MATKKIGGPTFVRIDGTLLRSKGDVTYSAGGVQAEDIVGSDGVHGYTEKPISGMLKLTVSVTDDLDVGAICKKRGATVSAALPSGKTFTLPNAWCVSPGEVNSVTGEVEFEFRGEQGFVR